MIPNSISNNPYMNENSEMQWQSHQQYNRTFPVPQPLPVRIPEDQSEYLHTHSNKFATHSVSIPQNTHLVQLTSELEHVNSERLRMRKQIDLYLVTIQKLKALNADQQDVINRLNNYREQTGGYSQALNQRNLDLNNEIQNLLLQREMVASKIASEQMFRERELESLAYRLTERDNQNFELKKKLNAVSEIKMRLQSDIASLKFSYENVKNKAQLELRERAFRLQQNEKTLQDAIRNKDDEIRYLLDKVRGLEDQVRRQKDNETLLLTKIADQSRMYPESSIKSNGKQNNRDRQNESNRLIGLLEEKDRKLSQRDRDLANLRNQLQNLNMKVSASQSAMQAMSKLNEKRSKQETQVQNTPPSMIRTIQRIRLGIVDLVFQVYVNSIDVADKKKSNSLVLFMTNMNDFLMKQGRQLRISLDAYEDTKKSIEHYLNSKAMPPEQKQLLYESIGKFSADDNHPRDKMNKWIEGTIVYTVEQKRIDKSDKNKEMLFLFRLLTIKYRIAYPIKGQEIRVDDDLSAILDNKIVGSVKHFLNKQE